jgi:hypothetical protein
MAMKIYGSYGYSTEYPCGRWLRDAKQFETLEGTSNIHMGIVAGSNWVISQQINETSLGMQRENELLNGKENEMIEYGNILYIHILKPCRASVRVGKKPEKNIEELQEQEAIVLQQKLSGSKMQRQTY